MSNSLLDVLGLDGLEAVVGRVEGGKEEPDKGVDRTGHLEMKGNVRFGQDITLEHVYELYIHTFCLFCFATLKSEGLPIYCVNTPLFPVSTSSVGRCVKSIQTLKWAI